MTTAVAIVALRQRGRESMLDLSWGEDLDTRRALARSQAAPRRSTHLGGSGMFASADNRAITVSCLATTLRSESNCICSVEKSCRMALISVPTWIIASAMFASARGSRQEL